MYYQFSLTLIYNQFFLPMIKSMFEVDGWIQIIAFITYISMLVLFLLLVCLSYYVFHRIPFLNIYFVSSASSV